MFREVAVTVEVGSARATFEFALPLSILGLVVTQDDATVWEFEAVEFRPMVPGEIQAWRIDEAPPEVLEMLKMAQSRLDRRLQDAGPLKPPIRAITYGAVPPGFRETVPAQALSPGRYHLSVSAEQGRCAHHFEVPAV
jgi:hypothetical protein